MKQRGRISANQLQRMPINENILRSVAAQTWEEEGGAGDQEDSMWPDVLRVARRSDQTNIRGRRRASIASGASAGSKLGGLGGRRRGPSRLAQDNRVHTFIDPRIWIGRL